MPLHEYRCVDCDGEFEMLRRPADPAPVCPSCGSQQLERVLSMFAVSSTEQSKRALTQAREAYRTSKARRDHFQHQGDVIREHLQDDYGVDLARRTPAPPASAPATTPPAKTPTRK